MARPTLNTGDIWSSPLANSSIRPIIDGQDNPGSAALIRDANMSPDSDQLLSKFNGFYDRVKVSVSSGLVVAYTGAIVVLGDGSRVILSAGNLVLPNNASSFIYISSAGAVASSLTLPGECIPLAFAIASGGAITQLNDLRKQVTEQVRPVKLPAATSPFLPGDIKPTFSTIGQSGWLFAEGQSLSTVDYSALFGAIGYTYGGSGLVFNLPDLRGRVLMSISPSRLLGSAGGTETTTLGVSELPTHGHGVADSGHSHGLNDPGHVHGLNDPSHGHTVNDPGHFHRLRDVKQAALNANDNDGSGAELSSQGTGNTPPTDSKETGITNQRSVTNISMNASGTGMSANPAATGIVIAPQGGGAPFSNLQPFIVVRYLIKA
jgi:microcystin-dependent protein